MDVKKTVTCLAYFEYNVEGPTFEKLFLEAGGTKHMANHMWGKFNDYDHSFLRLFGMADSDNRKKLLDVASKWCEKNDWPGKDD